MPEDPTALRSSLVSDPPGLTVTGLKPGDTLTTTVTVTNSSPYPVELSSHVAREGVLFGGAHPLVVHFDIHGRVGGGCPGDAHALSAGESATVRVDVAFPAAAGNEYQAQSGSATLFFTATQLSPEHCATVSPPLSDAPGRLPSTGIDASGLIVLAVGLVVFGVLLRALVRTRGAGAWRG